MTLWMQYFTDLNLLFIFNNSCPWFVNSLTVDYVSWSKRMPGYFFQGGQKIFPHISSSVFSDQILVLFEGGFM